MNARNLFTVVILATAACAGCYEPMGESCIDHVENCHLIRTCLKAGELDLGAVDNCNEQADATSDTSLDGSTDGNTEPPTPSTMPEPHCYYDTDCVNEDLCQIGNCEYNSDLGTFACSYEYAGDYFKCQPGYQCWNGACKEIVCESRNGCEQAYINEDGDCAVLHVSNCTPCEEDVDCLGEGVKTNPPKPCFCGVNTSFCPATTPTCSMGRCGYGGFGINCADNFGDGWECIPNTGKCGPRKVSCDDHRHCTVDSLDVITMACVNEPVDCGPNGYCNDEVGGCVKY